MANAFPLLLLSGCFDDPYVTLRTEVADSGKLASICLRDVGHVPFEHSGNCIAANRYFWDLEAGKTSEMQVCIGQTSAACHKIGQMESEILGTLHNSIAHSLFRFGKPRLVLLEERNGTHTLMQSGFEFYRSMPDLDAAFAACLTEHPDPPKPPPGDSPTVVNGKPVISMPPLQNFNCIPEGVDLYGFKPLP